MKIRVYNAEVVEEAITELKSVMTASMFKAIEAGDSEKVKRRNAAITVLGVLEDRLFALPEMKVDDEVIEEES